MIGQPFDYDSISLLITLHEKMRKIEPPAVGVFERELRHSLTNPVPIIAFAPLRPRPTSRPEGRVSLTDCTLQQLHDLIVQNLAAIALRELNRRVAFGGVRIGDDK